MLPTIQRTDRFQEEYKKFKSVIDKMPNDSNKIEAERLLNKLVNEVRLLDRNHNDMIQNRQLGQMSAEIRERIVSLRKRLDKKINDWKRTNQA